MRVSISRRFAVLVENGGRLVAVHFLWRRTEFQDDGSAVSRLHHGVEKFSTTGGMDRDHLISLLRKADLTVRFYERDERAWMQHSLRDGLEPANGNRDGTWGVPDLETFESEYLRIS